MKSTIYLIILTLIIFTGIGYVSGVACTSTSLTEDCGIGTSLTMTTPAGYMWNLSDANTNGSIVLTAGNLVFDCNYNLLIGNNITNSRGIAALANYNNLTLKNCLIQGYDFSTRLSASNLTIQNFSFSYCKSRAIFSLTGSKQNITDSYFNNCSIYSNDNNDNYLRNVFTNIKGIKQFEFDKASFIFINNNTFDRTSDLTDYNYVIQFINSDNMTIDQNYFNGNDENIFFRNMTNVTIRNNYVHNQTIRQFVTSTYPFISPPSSNVYIINNSVDLGELTILLQNTSNILVQGNLFNNTYTGDYDGNNYDGPIVIGHFSSNALVKDNRLFNYGDYGILVRGSNNVSIINNSGTHATDSMRQKYPISSSDGEATSFIVIPTIYKGYFDVGIYSSWSCENYTLTNNVTNYLINCSYQDRSTNIFISNNSVDNTTAYIIAEQVINLTYDFSNYWIRIIGLDQNYYGNRTYIIPNILDNLNSYGFLLLYNYSQNRMITIIRYYPHTEYNISKTLFSFNHRNMTTESYIANKENYSIGIYSASSYYPFNDLYNVSSSTILASNVDNYSISLLPNQQISVGKTNWSMCQNVSGSISLDHSITNSSFCFNSIGYTNVSLTNFGLNYPFVNLINNSNRFILFSNVSNLSIFLPSGSYSIGNSQVVVNFSSVVNGSSPNGQVTAVILDNNDALFANYSIQLQDAGYNLLRFFVTNQSRINYTFSNLAYGIYYVKVVEQDSNNNFNYLNSYGFAITGYSNTGCNSNTHSIWIVMIIIFVVGFLVLLYDTLTNDFSIYSLIALTVVASLIGYMITMLSATC